MFDPDALDEITALAQLVNYLAGDTLSLPVSSSTKWPSGGHVENGVYSFAQTRATASRVNGVVALQANLRTMKYRRR